MWGSKNANLLINKRLVLIKVTPSGETSNFLMEDLDDLIQFSTRVNLSN